MKFLPPKKNSPCLSLSQEAEGQRERERKRESPQHRNILPVQWKPGLHLSYAHGEEANCSSELSSWLNQRKIPIWYSILKFHE